MEDEPPGGQSGQPRLCAPCRAAQPPPVPRRSSLPLLTGLACAALAGTSAWMGLRLQALEKRLEALGQQVKEIPPPPEGPFTPGEAEALKPLARTPPASRAELETLKSALASLREEALHPGGLSALRPMKPVPEAPTPLLPPPVEPPPAMPIQPEKPEDVLDLSKDLASEDALTRHQALALLQRVDQAPAAARLLKDEMGFVRRNAAEALGRLKVPETVPALTAMARTEKDLLARRAALQALETITHVPCLAPESSEAEALGRCEAWWEKKRSAP